MYYFECAEENPSTTPTLVAVPLLLKVYESYPDEEPSKPFMKKLFYLIDDSPGVTGEFMSMKWHKYSKRNPINEDKFHTLVNIVETIANNETWDEILS